MSSFAAPVVPALIKYLSVLPNATLLLEEKVLLRLWTGWEKDEESPRRGCGDNEDLDKVSKWYGANVE